MKVLTLTQPWASLIGRGKSIETRSWRTPYRGRLAIHAAKGFPKDAREFTRTARVHDALQEDFPNREDDFTLGAIVAVVTLSDCRVMQDSEDDPFFDAYHEFDIGIGGTLTEQERAFGCYEVGRFAWIFTDIKLLSKPIPARGALGLWEFDIREVDA